MTAHSFTDSLGESRAWSDAPWWGEVYRNFFHNFESMTCVRNDGWAQRGGIDRVITLSSGKCISVDEKVRSKDYGDILLEYWSDKGRKVPGWVAKDLACDFIAYAAIPTQRCYLLPFLTLRKAWRANGKRWVNTYRVVDAHNVRNGNRWVTRSVAVPTDVLLKAINNAMLTQWGSTDVLAQA